MWCLETMRQHYGEVSKHLKNHFFNHFSHWCSTYMINCFILVGYFCASIVFQKNICFFSTFTYWQAAIHVPLIQDLIQRRRFRSVRNNCSRSCETTKDHSEHESRFLRPAGRLRENLPIREVFFGNHTYNYAHGWVLEADCSYAWRVDRRGSDMRHHDPADHKNI